MKVIFQEPTPFLLVGSVINQQNSNRMKAKKENFKRSSLFYHFRMLDGCKPYFSVMTVTDYKETDEGFAIKAKVLRREGEAKQLGRRFAKHWKDFELSATSAEIEEMLENKEIQFNIG